MRAMLLRAGTQILVGIFVALWASSALGQLSQLSGKPLPELDSVVQINAPYVTSDGCLDLDAYLAQAPAQNNAGAYRWQLLPDSLMYKAYLAGVKESRMSTTAINVDGQGWLWDSTLGARVGLLRYGDCDPLFPNGFQWDVEGSAQLRLKVPQDMELQSTDYRAGAPLSYGYGPHRFKFGYYHLSSHLGDEFLLRNPGFVRQNYVREALVLGYSFYALEDLKLYAEADWAFSSDVSEPWAFQFGLDYAPVRPTGFRGAPFFAVNVHIRQELDFSGNVVVQGGWAWLSDQNSRLFRIGVHFYDGKSSQYSFYQVGEQQIGIGLWYDF